MSLEQILNNSETRALFQLHCIEELCSENLFFMIQWKEFKKIHDRNELKKAASEIFESFIMDDSEFELNLSVKFKKEMYTIFNNKEIKVDTDIFNGVAFDVEWMLSDCLERFQQKINEKEEVTSKQFFGRLSTMSRKIRRIKGLVNEGIQAFDRERRRSSSNSNSLYISNNTIDIIKNQSKLQHNSFFENDDDDKEEFFIRNFLNTKEEYKGSFQLSKKTTIVDFQMNPKSDWC